MAKSRFPHPLVLLSACIVLAAVASYVLPAGQYDRQQDEATGREVVVAGTYHEVEPNPVAILATAGVRYEGWVKFAMPVFAGGKRRSGQCRSSDRHWITMK